jgi:hypothetical protein
VFLVHPRQVGRVFCLPLFAGGGFAAPPDASVQPMWEESAAKSLRAHLDDWPI